MKKHWRQIIHKTNLYGPPHQLGLEYALMISFAVSTVTLAWHFYAFPNFLLTALSAGLSIFFAYGKRLWQRILSLSVGCLYMTVICLIAHALFGHIIATLIYVMILVFLSYYLSIINSFTLFTCKISLTFLAFVLFPNTGTAHTSLQAMAITMIEGGFFALASLILFHPLNTYIQSNNRNINNCLKLLKTVVGTPINQWHHDDVQLLGSKTEQLRDSIGHDYINSTHITNIADAINTLYQFFTGPHEWIFIKDFSDDFNHFLGQISQAIQHMDETRIEQDYQAFKLNMDKKRDSGYLETISQQDRIQILLCLFNIHQLSHNIKFLIKSYQQHQKKSIWQQLKFKGESDWFSIPKNSLDFFRDKTTKTLSCATKIAIRSTIALSTAYVLAMFFSIKYGAWVFLTANLVLLNRPGETIKRSWHRVSGHVIGFFVGIPLGFLWYYHPWPYLWVPILVFLCGYAFIKNYFVFSTTIMLMILYLYSKLSPAPFTGLESIQFMSYRLLDTMIGAAIATSTCLLVFPKTGDSSIEDILNKLCLSLSHVSHALANLLKDKHKADALLNSIQDSQDIKDMANTEIQDLHFQPAGLKQQYQYLYNTFLKESTLLIQLNEIGNMYSMIEQDLDVAPIPASSIHMLMEIAEDLQSILQTPTFKPIKQPNDFNQWLQTTLTLRDKKILSIDKTVIHIAFIHAIDTARNNANLLLSSLSNNTKPNDVIANPRSGRGNPDQ